MYYVYVLGENVTDTSSKRPQLKDNPSERQHRIWHPVQ